jgi:hypothetical protein
MRRSGLIASTLVLLLLSMLLPAAATAAERPTPQPLPVSDSPPVVPVLSPALKDIPPLSPGAGDHRTVVNLEYPHPTPVGDRPIQPDTALQTSFGVSAPTATGVNFDGIPANGFAPPDNDGKVGPNHYIQWINVQFAIYDKSGTKLYGPAAGNTLFTALGPNSACVTHNDGDPIVEYDQLADRWVLSQFVVGASPNFSHQCVAVSTTGDPLGTYYLYDFVTDATNFVDYPHWGVWPDSYYQASHLFNAAGTAFLGQTLYAFERPKMLAGLPARVQGVNLGTGVFGALPTDLDGLTPPPAASPNYVMAPGSPELDGSPSPVIHVWKAGPATWGGSPTLPVTGPTDVATAAFNGDLCNFARSCVPQSGTTNGVDAISDRFMWRLAYRNMGGTESIVATHTVNVAAASGHATNQAGLRWYEIRTPGTSPTIFQQGTYAPADSNWRWMGSIAMDNSGDMALGYSKSSSSIFPEIDITGRLVGDAPGTMGAEAVMKAGLGNQNGTLTRWGDYTAMTVDPRDGCTFWYTNQYQPANGTFNWSTRIASFRFPSCVSPARGTITGFVTDCVTGAPVVGALVSVNNGFSGTTNALGQYTIVLPPGSYTVGASADQHACTPASGTPVNVTDGNVSTANFCLTGSAVLSLGTVGVDDSAGNNNGVINKDECVKLQLPISNDGCAVDTGASGTLTTSTPNVTITQATSAYPNIAPGFTQNPIAKFGLSTSPSFVCGTPIALTLTVTSSHGTDVFNFSVPTCGQTLNFSGSIAPGDATQNGRLNRFAPGSSCPSKACPGLFATTGARAEDIYSFTNNDTAAHCVTIRTTTACTGTNFIFPVAYLGTFDPTNLCLNYLGDPGASPSPSNTFDVNVGAGQTIKLVVHEVTPGSGCSGYTVQVTGLVDPTDAGGAGCGATTPAANFFSLQPCRVTDTRVNGPALAAGTDRTYLVAGTCGIPSNASAISANVTVTQPTSQSDLKIFAAGTTIPTATVISFNSGNTRANNAIIQLGPGGTITVHDDQASGTVHFILDVNGYFQ